MMNIKVGIIMGSRSDWETMQHASETLDALGLTAEELSPTRLRDRRQSGPLA